MSNQKESADLKVFLEAIYKNFTLLSFDDDVFYHFWKGKKDLVGQYFDGFSFPKIKDLIALTKIPDDIFVLVASDISKNKLIASAIMKVNHKGEFQVISFIVHPELRNSSNGKKLLGQVENLAQQLGVKRIIVKYRSFWKSNEYWEKLLEGSNWTDKTTVLHYFSLPDVKTQFQENWFLMSKLPESFKVKEWDDSTSGQLKELLSTSNWKAIFPREVNPLQMEDKILRYASLILYKNDKIVGWIICHLIQPGIAQVSALFTHPTEARGGMGMSLVAEAAKRGKGSNRIIFSVKDENEIVLNMIDKYTAKDDLDHNYQYQRAKVLPQKK